MTDFAEISLTTHVARGLDGGVARPSARLPFPPRDEPGSRDARPVIVPTGLLQEDGLAIDAVQPWPWAARLAFIAASAVGSWALFGGLALALLH